MPRYLLAPLALLFAFAVTPEAQTNVVSAEIAQAFQARGEARVVIMLESPAVKRVDLTDLAAVKREVDAVQESVLATLGASSYVTHHQYETVPALVLTLTSKKALDQLLAHPHVRKVDLDVGGSGGLDDSVALIRADERQTKGNSGSGIVVAVIDSGIDTDHADFSGRIAHQECFLDTDGTINGVGQCPDGSDRQTGAGSAEDDHGHGTHVAGIVASGGTVSSVGVAPGADIVAIKVLNSNNSFFYFSEIVAALDFVSANPALGVQVINMSLGTNAQYAGDCDDAAAFTMAGAAAINSLRANGVIAMASAGNNGSGTTMGAPACISNVISVGATDDNDSVTGFSQSNSTTDVFAPGNAIVAPWFDGATAVLSGTSMASPHVAGCAALLIESGDATTPDAIEAFLEASPVLVTDVTNGLSFPRLDCAPTLTATLTGVRDYRVLALPTGGTYDDLLGPLWTQGFQNSDDASGGCSAYSYDETAASFEGGYTCLTDQGATFARGRGAYVYVYADDDLDASGVQGGFPKTLSVPDPGFTNSGAPFTFAPTYTNNLGVPSYQEGWNLLGNPLTAGMDWDETIRGGGLTPTIYVLDPNYFGGDYRTWTAGIGGDLPGGVVPAFQGFFAKAVAASPTLEAPLASVVDPGPGVYGKTERTPLRLELSTAAGPVSAAFVAVAPEAALGEDVLDAYRLTPAAYPRTVLSTSSIGAEPVPLALNALPQEASGEMEVPLTVAAEGHTAGPLALSLAWSGALPEGWTATLVDRTLGTATPLAESGTYAFTLDVSETAKRSAALGLDLMSFTAPEAKTGGTADSGDRFVLRIAPASAVSTDATPEAGFALGAPSPNPARGMIRVPYALASSGEAEVSVVDALGREVAVLASGAHSAGSHEAALDASTLAPGVYVVRLSTPEASAVRRVTVVR
ncbi:S8 family serine peptidase [Rubricoccus marinus]|uniref:Peptidase S8/S53 domain-containing protein n=1 Tax=Rubricoccus marinus TaxID=716817 RepID=A0A259TWW0_9BACT|nr:S8 family serine peptidase [Rubricoccus marinus]OZC02064.1 hypothetical protein BSZ36_03135 [Rubricoccus marinus]